MVAADFTKADEREFLEKYNIVLVQYSNRDNSHLELRRMLKTVDRFIASRGRVWRPDARESRPTEEVEAAIAIFLYRRLQGVQVVDYLAPLVLSGLQLADRERTPRSDVMSLPMLRGVVANDERYQDAIEETIGNLVRERLVAVIDEDVEITDIGRARVEEYRVVRETEVDQAYGQFTLNAGRIFGALNEEQVKQCRRLAEEVIVDSFANRGSTMAGKVFSGRKALPDELSDIFGLVSNRAVEIVDAKLRGAFIEAMHEFVVEPNEAQRRYLASVSQGYFLYHLLGLDPKCAEVRRNIFQKTLWVCDSSVVLPLVASGCHNHEYAVELFRMLIGENALLYTTRRLLQEAWEHLDWAVRFMQKKATEPLELLRAASVRGSYKQNLFLDGYIRLSADGAVGTFGEYLKLVFPDGMVRRDAFEDRVVHAGLRVVDTADINARRPVDRSELQTAMDRIRRVREDRGTYRSQLQVESEAEVWILMNSMNSGKLTMRDADVEHVYFVSQSRTMDHVFQSESSITWTPESLYRYLSSLPQRGAMNADLLQQCMLHEYYYAGVSFIDKQRYEQFFGGVIDAARASYEKERDGYIRDLEETYTVGIDEAFHRTVDLEKPFFVAQMGWQRAEALGRREEAALRRAAEAEARVKELESEKDKAWKAREERKRRQEAATLRNLQDPKPMRAGDRDRRRSARRSSSASQAEAANRALRTWDLSVDRQGVLSGNPCSRVTGRGASTTSRLVGWSKHRPCGATRSVACGFQRRMRSSGCGRIGFVRSEGARGAVRFGCRTSLRPRGFRTR